MFKIDLKKYDLWLLVAVLSLILIGILSVFSSSVIMAELKWDTPYSFIIRHCIWIIFGSALAFFAAFYIDCSFYQRYCRILYAAIFIALILVLIFGINRGGATRWFNFHLFTMQPSEIAKMVLVFTIADFIARKRKSIHLTSTTITAVVLIFIILIPIAVEPDLGAPILIFSVCFAMLFCAGINLKAAAAVFALLFLFVIEESFRMPYRFERLKGYLVTFPDMNSTSYQLKQSINALGSGGLTGKGLGNSELKRMYLPEAHTDFIFSIIGEEFGFIGALVVIALFILIFIRGMRIYGKSSDLFTKYLALGLTLLIVIEALMNLLVAAGLVPTKGLVLPFISFGGTAMAMNLTAVGILLNLSKFERRL
ncbi:MAG: putative lipid II flippase FtsW [Elusimicrobiota bacterium]|jgi:cell division protein FtsW|nr:putative lipid II flippase FtsW [Elusimicrobiota bacterium]